MQPPALAVLQPPLLVVVHEGVQHAPGGGVRPPQQEQAQGQEAGVQVAALLARVYARHLRGLGQHAALRAVPLSLLARGAAH